MVVDASVGNAKTQKRLQKRLRLCLRVYFYYHDNYQADSTTDSGDKGIPNGHS